MQPRPIMSFLIFIVLWGSAFSPSFATAAAQTPSFVVPQWKSDDGQVAVRMRGRWQQDYFSIKSDFGDPMRDKDYSSENLRGLRIGLDGSVSSQFAFRAEVDFINEQTNWNDVFVTYRGKNHDLTLGQQFQASSLEGSMPNLVFLLPEASLMTNALSMRMRAFGLSARWRGNKWQAIMAASGGNINAGDIFGDDVIKKVQARVSYAPINQAGNVLHFGINARSRETQDGPRISYRARPAGTAHSPRTIDSGAIASGDANLGLETIWIKGQLSLSAEAQHVWSDQNHTVKPLSGGYLEASYWLTGERRNYSYEVGNFTTVTPKKSLLKGGVGGIAIVSRIEFLDLGQSSRPVSLAQPNPAGISQGRAEAVSVGLVWLPVEYVMFRLGGAQTRYDGQARGFDGKGKTRVVTARVQFSF
ncbi:OprO/OprP family phosphate-selective porin [Candidatus Phycosocius spiralis]|uniref:Porin n=1 Tax=Candidatus Phycosocius spiralis TaxID=2815099 RepID=A0ABQ4PWH1_9PROT|nr:porin [Candidatus Phycosocius spiralis]GIU67023.1 porin [Candidatus Phycosocius spiralis]